MHQVEGHVYLMVPVSRNFWATDAFQESSYSDINWCPHCFQSRGPSAVRERGEENTEEAVLAMYGRGEWPHLFSYERNEVHGNGNYYEPEEISVRHGICGDPEQTKAEGTNLYGQENSKYPVHGKYSEGGIIEIKIVVSTYHWVRELPELSAQGFICGIAYLAFLVLVAAFAVVVFVFVVEEGEWKSAPTLYAHRAYEAVPGKYRALDYVHGGSGHLEFFICNAEDMSDPDGVVTQGCFNMHPLDRADDDGDASPIDPDHIGRYYLDPPCRAGETDQDTLPGAYPGDVATARYKLPSGLTCSRCILQMVYYTGNACKHPGYDEFDPVSVPDGCAPTKEDWVQTQLGMCGEDGRYPEEFWNCADIEITSDEDGGGPAPTTPSPTDEEELSPTPEPSVPTVELPRTPEYGEPTPAPPVSGMESTPVPSVAPASPTATSCDDPAEVYEQCGGDDSYDGRTCCVENSECVELADCYSECRPAETTPEDNCSGEWGQCGGNQWQGPTCCEEGNDCVVSNEWYHQCIPETT
ncbi:unnamed protein product [Ectocarpus sp. CCAP 1310/34]|nr:unnamed protein product [Ectocarpus sp. CCAP 1310/34]